MKSKYFIILLTALLLIFSLVNCQDSAEDEEEDEEYEEEAGDNKETTKTTKPLSKDTTKSNSTTPSNSTTGTKNGIATEDQDDEEKVESTTRELDYIFKPVNSLLKNVGQGNITGIVDMALSIRAPPGVRELVNSIMKMVFGAGEALTSSIVAAYMQTTAAPDTAAAVAVDNLSPAAQQTTIKSSSPQKSIKDGGVKNNI